MGTKERTYVLDGIFREVRDYHYHDSNGWHTEQYHKEYDLLGTLLMAMGSSIPLIIDSSAAFIDKGTSALGKPTNLRDKFDDFLMKRNLKDNGSVTTVSFMSSFVAAITAISLPFSISYVNNAKKGNEKFNSIGPVDILVASVTGFEEYPTDLAAAKQYCADYIKEKSELCTMIASKTKIDRINNIGNKLNALDIHIITEGLSGLNETMWQQEIRYKKLESNFREKLTNRNIELSNKKK